MPLSDPRIARGLQAQFALRRDLLAAGHQPIGWKVGFGTAAGMAKLKTTAPLVGFMLARSVVASGATVSLAGWSNPVIEPEIAVEMGADLAADADLATVVAAIAAIGPAIELVDVGATDDPEPILAGDIFHRHVVPGPRTPWPGASSTGLSARVRRSGVDMEVPADVTSATGPLPPIIRHVANVLAAMGEKLRAGDLVITGSIIPPVPLAESDTSFDYTLTPIGDVAVRFSR